LAQCGFRRKQSRCQLPIGKLPTRHQLILAHNPRLLERTFDFITRTGTSFVRSATRRRPGRRGGQSTVDTGRASQSIRGAWNRVPSNHDRTA
jgi:hypothetical protein